MRCITSRLGWEVNNGVIKTIHQHGMWNNSVAWVYKVFSLLIGNGRVWDSRFTSCGFRESPMLVGKLIWSPELHYKWNTRLVSLIAINGMFPVQSTLSKVWLPTISTCAISLLSFAAPAVQDLHERGGWSKHFSLFAGTIGLARLAISYLYKDEFHLDPSTVRLLSWATLRSNHITDDGLTDALLCAFPNTYLSYSIIICAEDECKSMA